MLRHIKVDPDWKNCLNLRAIRLKKLSVEQRKLKFTPQCDNYKVGLEQTYGQVINIRSTFFYLFYCSSLTIELVIGDTQ